MKVLHVITESNLGGAQRNTLLTVKGLIRRGFDVHVACGPHGPGDAEALPREATACGATVHRISSLVRRINPVMDAAAFAALARLLIRGRYDVVHTHSTKAGMLGRLAARALHVPMVVHTFHGVPFDTRGNGWKTRSCFAVERFFSRFCDRLVSVGGVLGEELMRRKAAPAEKIETIRSGVDFSELDNPPSKPSARRRLNLPDSVPVVGFVGRLAQQKAPEVLMQAFVTVKSVFADARLVLVGEGPLRSQLERMAVQTGLDGCVHILGERGDVPQILPAFDVFALPSRWEGIGRALTEAMYLKLPVVCTGVNGVPELVKHEATGLIVQVDNPAEIANGILDVLTDSVKARRLGDAAHRIVRDLMSADAMIDAIIELYERLSYEGIMGHKGHIGRMGRIGRIGRIGLFHGSSTSH